jgi:CRISPR-associated protein Csm2
MAKITVSNYVTEAESVVKNIAGKHDKISTSQIRNLLSLVSDVENTLEQLPYSETLDERILTKIPYMKVKIVYAAGRDLIVRDFVTASGILENIDTIKDSRKQFDLFSRYMEALVAYHKFYIGNDKTKGE